MVKLYTVAGSPFLGKHIEGGINAQTASYPNNTSTKKLIKKYPIIKDITAQNIRDGYVLKSN